MTPSNHRRMMEHRMMYATTSQTQIYWTSTTLLPLRNRTCSGELRMRILTALKFVKSTGQLKIRKQQPLTMVNNNRSLHLRIMLKTQMQGTLDTFDVQALSQSLLQTLVQVQLVITKLKYRQTIMTQASRMNVKRKKIIVRKWKKSSDFI